jgi:hypothetical protein
MLSVEECKKYIGDQGLSDQQIERIANNLQAFLEQAVDFVFEAGTLANKQKNEKSKEGQNRTAQGNYLLPSVIRKTKNRGTRA